VSAVVSSLIPSAVEQPGHDLAAVRAGDGVPVDLLEALAAVVDPRAAGGIRHRLVVILGIAVCATLGGARSFTEIAEWGRDLTARARDRLGIARIAPSETAIRRTVQRVDPDLLDGCVSAWIATQGRGLDAGAAGRCRAWQVIALDGKTARGARCGEDRAVHLMAAFDDADGVVLGQAVWTGRPIKSRHSRRCWTGSRSPARSSRQTPCTLGTVMRSTCMGGALTMPSRSRAISRPCGIS